MFAVADPCVAASGNDINEPVKLNVTGAVMVDILPPLIDCFLNRFPDVWVELVVKDNQ
jgi:hypothetical protein